MLYKIKKVIDEWNPYELLPDAPDDEFLSESRKIASIIKCDDSVDKIAQVVSTVFTQAFGEGERFNLENCKNVALKIKNAIVND
ncbi:MAG: DUF1871 family protein [Clostridia bacterium]|nr:DUF1871 family protein [Clostridia bacterium]